MKFNSLVVSCATMMMLTPVAANADVVMTFGYPGAATETSDDHIAGLALEEYIERESNGEIDVQLFPAAQLGNMAEMAEQVSNGTLDGENLAIVFLSSFIPELSIVEMPYVLDGYDHAQAFAQTGIQEFLAEEIAAAIPNLNLVNLTNTGNFRSFYTTVPVQNAEDMRGVEIRTVPSPLAIRFVEELGAVPVPMGWGEVYSSLQTGLAQGTKNAAIDIVPSRLNEVVDHAVLDLHSYLMGANIVSQSFLDSLSDEHREIVLAGLDHAATVQSEYNRGFEQEALAMFVDGGGTVHEPSTEERATFMAAREPVMEWFVSEYGENGQRWLNAFMSFANESR